MKYYIIKTGHEAMHDIMMQDSGANAWVCVVTVEYNSTCPIKASNIVWALG